MDLQENAEHTELSTASCQENMQVTDVNKADVAVNSPAKIVAVKYDKLLIPDQICLESEDLSPQKPTDISLMETDERAFKLNTSEKVSVRQQELKAIDSSFTDVQNTNEQIDVRKNELALAKEKLLHQIDVTSQLEPNTQNSTAKNLPGKEYKAKVLAVLDMGKNNFFKGCKWAPDGLCLMTNSEDNVIRLINTPHDILAKKWDKKSIKMEICLKIKEAETIYDYAWWPQMNSLYPATCCLATTAKDQPIHLWDAFNGDLRASYIARNNVDEVHAAHSLAFSPDGMQMICGFSKEIRLFYIDRPGDYCEKWPTRKEKHTSGQRGIISTLEFSPDASTFACGSYDGTAAIYSAKNGDAISIFDAKTSGVTFIKFSPDGNRLYLGSRKNNSIICWDIRNMGGDLFHLDRIVDTNQRIYFDIASTSVPSRDMVIEDIIVSGGTDGMVSIWDVSQVISDDHVTGIVDTSIKPVLHFEAHKDCTNGVNIHPFLPVLATSSGQRHFNDISDSENDSEVENVDFEENAVKLWHINGFHF